MIGVSDSYKSQVKTSHQSRCLVEVVQNGAVVATLNVHAGQVDADRTAANMRRFTADVADPDGTLTPDTVRAILAPFGTLIRIYRGVEIPGVEIVEQIEETQADWNTGDFTNIVANPDDTISLG